MDAANTAGSSSAGQPPRSLQPLLVRVSQETSNYGRPQREIEQRNTFVDKKKSEWSAAKHTFGRNRKAASTGHGRHAAAVQTIADEAPDARSRVIHPYGFRILKDTSVIERSLKGYFRLPPAPSRVLRAERERLHEKLISMDREEARERRQIGGEEGVILDGFLILSAASVENPEEVETVTLQNSNLVGSVLEDLMYFENLFF
ncbi:hypothetical protein STCU_11924 [Strigomonas culicis]|uniref:Uncharacterized protein n=1 Tax=Strigomonas culicis TaxID=28005 RepID=S9ULM1_9TRYP|nr:hypothetical protein STCU_11924 [Strigomonas culicis]|eukprot:EPY15571.1 hypothetical protein STCU_11924 [Strigomonas culicis]